MQIERIMSTEVEVIDRNDDLATVEALMEAKGVRHVPVLEDGKVVAIVTQRDLFKAAMSSAMGYGEKARTAYLHSVRVKEIMVYPVITVTPETSLHDAIDLMLKHGIGCLPVLRDDTLVGLVTKTDLLRHLRSGDA